MKPADPVISAFLDLLIIVTQVCVLVDIRYFYSWCLASGSKKTINHDSSLIYFLRVSRRKTNSLHPELPKTVFICVKTNPWDL